MDEETFDIRYRFTLPDGVVRENLLRIDAGTLELRQDKAATPPPEWAALGVHQCPHCPLTADQHPYCPVAVNIWNAVAPFGPMISHQMIRVEIAVEHREIASDISAQRAISSYMGLVVATSACPRTAFLKPMARFHLPLASLEETIWRVVSAYLIAQHFLRQDGVPVESDFSGLNAIYEDLMVMNQSMAKRLRKAVSMSNDAGINALVILDTFAQTVPLCVDGRLDSLRPLFEPYLRSLRALDT